ncbi:hypothetical protein NRBB11_1608 [Bifidobacterium breve]|nr:hypothetical protein NRBB11_0430 [Bifidobacterium breve]AUD75328.1 hypothetical protein NRBB11_1608 [Bifidobacterium breve]
MFISRHTLKWTKTCRSSGDFPHAHTAHFLLNRHMAHPVEGLHRRTHLCEGRPREPEGIQTGMVVDPPGAAPLLSATGKAVPRGQAVRVPRPVTDRRRPGGAHHEPIGGRRQLAAQTHAPQPSGPARGAHETRLRMDVLHEKPQSEAIVAHPSRTTEAGEGIHGRKRRRRRRRDPGIRHRHRLGRIPRPRPLGIG